MDLGVNEMKEKETGISRTNACFNICISAAPLRAFAYNNFIEVDIRNNLS